MQELNLKSTVIRKKKIPVFNEPIHKMFDNILKQNFNVNAPNIKWCSDLIYIKLANGKFKMKKINQYILKTYEIVREISLDYVHLYYNSRRPHNTLGDLTPLEKRYSEIA